MIINKLCIYEIISFRLYIWKNEWIEMMFITPIISLNSILIYIMKKGLDNNMYSRVKLSTNGVKPIRLLTTI